MEIIRLLMLTLKHAGIAEAHLDLGHVGIYRGLARQAGLDEGQEMAMFDALQRKALPEIEALIAEYGVRGATGRMLLALADLNGDDALERAGSELAPASGQVHAALAYLQRVAAEMHRWLPEVPVHFDLAARFWCRRGRTGS